MTERGTDISGVDPAGRRIQFLVLADLGLMATVLLYWRSFDNFLTSAGFDFLYEYGMRSRELGTLQAVLALPDVSRVNPDVPYA